MKKEGISTYKIAFVSVMAAVVLVVTMFSFPLLGSKVHFGNTMCLLSGLLFGPIWGGLAAGFGSGLYDLLIGGYGVDTAIITFVSKFAMALVCGLITRGQRESRVRTVIGCVVGALTYVCLYMLKTFIYQRFVYGYPMETAWFTMGSKLPASLINAVFAMIVAPILYAALKPALARAKLLDKLR